MTRVLVRHRRPAATLLLLLTLISPAAGQLPGLPGSSPAAKTAPEEDPRGRETPLGCVVGFLRAAERDDYGRAMEYLDIAPSSDAVTRARDLYTILNTRHVADLENLSRTPEGALDDGLPADREQVGSVKMSNGSIPILLLRQRHGSGPAIWLFSAQTLRRVPDAIEEIEGSGLQRYFPPEWREVRILSWPAYRWVETILGIAIAIGLAYLGSWMVFPVLRPVMRRITREQNDDRLNALRTPIWMLLLALAFRWFSGVTLTVLQRQVWTAAAMTISVFAFTLLITRSSDVVAKRKLRNTRAASQVAVFSLAHRLFKIGAWVTGMVAIIYAAGGNVSTILAGVGLGGIVIALAAQKTLENLFGGVSVISDEPVRVGDFCRFADKTGTVLDIGLRSTRVRTLDRTVVAIPNGQLSMMSLENYTLRDKFLFSHKIGLRYETTPAQLRQVLQETRGLLAADPRVDREDARVRLTGFGDSAFTIEVFAYLLAPGYNEFAEIQEELLFRILDLVVAAGSGLAFPSQTLYLKDDSEPGASKSSRAGIGFTRE